MSAADQEELRASFDPEHLTERSREQLERFRTAHQTQVLTILLSDLVGSTGQQSELGNVRAAQLVQAHRAIFREVLGGFDGEEVETAGDSFLLVFAAPSEAASFALHLQAAMRRARHDTPDLPAVRVGIHQGQVVVERHADGPKALDIYGLQVSTAARIMDLAAGGQVLCSRAVFDDARAILRGDHLADLGPVAWRNHGPYRFKGVEEAYEVCEAGEEGLAPLVPPPAGTKGWPADTPEEELGWRPAVGATVPGTSWRLEERLGRDDKPDAPGSPRFRGEFGEVWRAWNPSDRSRQVFKFCFRRDRLPALKREARLLKRLKKYRHPNLVEVYDVTEGDRPPYYLEMEYVEGPSLDEWLAADPPLGERLEVVAQVADALDTVHAAGIYHRDIKPSNILLTRREDGALQAKLTDFGLGAAEDEDLLRSILASRVSGVAGTWDYIAPEVREGAPPSPQSDLYSLGVTLYQVAVGDLRRPLGDWEASVPSVILREDIRRCIATDPSQRWASAADLARALRSHDERTRERQLEREREAQRRRAKRLGLVGGVAALIAAVTLGFGSYAWHQRNVARDQRDEAERQRSIAQTERERTAAEKVRAEHNEREARHQLGVALLERARALSRERYSQSAFLCAARSIGFDGHGGPFEGQPGLLRPGSDAAREAWELTLLNPFRLLWKTPGGRHHDGTVMAVAYSPDGSALASGASDGSIRVWDTRSGDSTSLLATLRDGVFALAWSPSGKTLASGGWDSMVRVYHVATARMIAVCPGHSGLVTCVSFSPDGATLASAGNDGTVRLWDAAAGEPIATLHGHEGSVNALAFFRKSESESERGKAREPHSSSPPLSPSPSPYLLVSAGADRTVRIWDLKARRQVAQLEGHTQSVFCLAISPDGRLLASGGKEKTIRLWDPKAARPIGTVETGEPEGWRPALGPKAAPSASGSPRTAVLTLSLSPDRSTLATGHEDASVRLWDVATRAETATLKGHLLPVWSVRFSPDGKSLASGSGDGSVRLWDVAKRAPLSHFGGGHVALVKSVSASPDGSLVASAGGDGTVRLWESTTGKPVATLLGHADAVACVAFCPRSESESESERGKPKEPHSSPPPLSPSRSLCPLLLASGGEDGLVCLWDVASGECLAELEGHDGAVLGLAFRRDGSVLASAGRDGTIRQWHMPEGKPGDVLGGGEGAVAVVSVSWSPDGALLAALGDDGKLRVWEVAARRVARVLEGWARLVRAIAFSPDGALLAAASEDSALVVWRTATYERESLSWNRGDTPTALGFSADSRLLAAGCADGLVRLWRLPNRQPLDVLEGHGGSVAGVAFCGKSESESERGKGRDTHSSSSPLSLSLSPSSLVSGSDDGTVRTWDIASGRPTAELDGHTASVLGVEFTADGHRLASASWDKTVRLWDVAAQKATAVLKAHRGEAFCVAVSPDGATLASTGMDGTVRLWDLATAQPVATLDAYAQGATCVVFTPDGKTLVSGGVDVKIRLWDVATRQPAGELLGHQAAVLSLAIDASSSVLLSGGEDRTVRVWDLASRQLVATLTGHEGGVSGVSINPAGTLGASGSWDKTVRLWDLKAKRVAAGAWTHRGAKLPGSFASGLPQAAAVLTAHADAVSSVRFGPRGETLASADLGGVARVWDVRGVLEGSIPRRPAAIFADPSLGFTALAFSPDGATLAVGTISGAIRLWPIRAPRRLPATVLEQMRSTGLEVEFDAPPRNLFHGAKAFCVWE